MSDATRPMALDAGARLGPYEILALLGRGGMGEVYRARDTRLNRVVAIKVLPSAVAEHGTRRARFEREAQAISQLSHPHICAVYDVGEDGGVAFLVMEYIAGESLESRLRRGPVPWPTTLAWSIQIASAIDAAHRRGIVHRDLKPANVMVGESGVKLLDFGLAKLLEGSEAGASAAELRSTASLTNEQKLVGTLNYMSPEQLEGREVDQRTDIFAFGTTLYELLTGRRAFDGASAASVSAAILTTEPPPVSSSGARAAVPAAVDHIVRRALAKDPEDRWQTARDVMLELQGIQDGRPRPAAVRGAMARGGGWPLGVAAAMLTAIGALAGWMLRAAPQTPDIATAAEFEIGPPAGTRLMPGVDPVSVSPDALKIAFYAGPIGGGPGMVYIRDLRSPETRLVPNTEGVANLFWSPDSQSIGYFTAAHQLGRIGQDGARQRILTTFPDAPWLRGNLTAVWRTDDTIVVPLSDGLYRVDANTGALARASTDQAGNFPSLLPNGLFLSLLRSSTTLHAGEAQIHAFDRPLRVSLPTVHSNVTYAAGYLVFRSGESLVAQRLDVPGLRLTGQPAVLAPTVQYNPGNGRSAFSVSGDLLAYRPERPRLLVWKSRNGKPIGSIGDTRNDWNPVMATDGSGRIAIDRFDTATDGFRLASIDEQGRVTTLTHGMRDRFAVWSPDGQWIAYKHGGPQSELRRVRTDGSGADEPLLRDETAIPLDWSPDARYLLYESGVPGDLWALPLAPPRTPIQLTRSPGRERAATFSPDGHWIAYTSAQDQESDVWVQPFPGGGASARQVSSGGGVQPIWRHDGKELFYMTPAGTVMALPISTTPTFTSGTPVALFATSAGSLGIYVHPFAVSPDGQRFLVTETAPERDSFTVVLHWPALVR